VKSEGKIESGVISVRMGDEDEDSVRGENGLEGN